MTAINFGLALYAGLLIGGFATVLVPRLHALPHRAGFLRTLRSLSLPPSSCVCGRHLTLGEKIPILGWFFARGRCRSCASRVSPIYPACELVIALLVVFMTSAAWTAAPGQFALLALIPGALFVVAALLLPIAPRAGASLALLTATSSTVASWAASVGLPLGHRDTTAFLATQSSLSDAASLVLGAAALAVLCFTPIERPGWAIRLGAAAAMALLAHVMPGAPQLSAPAILAAVLLSYRMPAAFRGEVPADGRQQSSRGGGRPS